MEGARAVPLRVRIRLMKIQICKFIRANQKELKIPLSFTFVPFHIKLRSAEFDAHTPIPIDLFKLNLFARSLAELGGPG